MQHVVERSDVNLDAGRGSGGLVSLPETPTERLMLEALLRDERTGPPSAVAIQSALQVDS